MEWDIPLWSWHVAGAFSTLGGNGDKDIQSVDVPIAAEEAACLPSDAPKLWWETPTAIQLPLSNLLPICLLRGKGHAQPSSDTTCQEVGHDETIRCLLRDSSDAVITREYHCMIVKLRRLVTTPRGHSSSCRLGCRSNRRSIKTRQEPAQKI